MSTTHGKPTKPSKPRVGWLRSMGSARVSLLEASVELSALVMPPEMATEIRLGQDLDLSAQVVEVVVEEMLKKKVAYIKENIKQVK